MQSTTSPSFKIKQRHVRPKDEWVKAENMRELIVSQTIFDMVQYFISLHKRPQVSTSINLFRGMVYCGDCGHKMSHHGCNAYSRAKGTVGSFVCNTYGHNKAKCSLHHTPYYKVYEYVLNEVNKIIAMQSDPAALSLLLENSITDDTETKKTALSKLLKRENDIEGTHKAGV